LHEPSAASPTTSSQIARLVVIAIGLGILFITVRAGNMQYSMSNPELFEQLRITRPQLNAIEEYGVAAYLFGPVEARRP
jgi:hypothetical protein